MSTLSLQQIVLTLNLLFSFRRHCFRYWAVWRKRYFDIYLFHKCDIIFSVNLKQSLCSDQNSSKPEVLVTFSKSQCHLIGNRLYWVNTYKYFGVDNAYLVDRPVFSYWHFYRVFFSSFIISVSYKVRKLFFLITDKIMCVSVSGKHIQHFHINEMNSFP